MKEINEIGISHGGESRDSQEARGKRPNDPKLSDRAARRDACPTAARTETKPSRKQREAKKARGVTRGPVRCSAWLGVADIREFIDYLTEELCGVGWEFDGCHNFKETSAELFLIFEKWVRARYPQNYE